MTQYRNYLKNSQRDGKPFCHFCSDEYCIDDTLPKNESESAQIAPKARTYPSKMLTLLEDVQANSLREKVCVTRSTNYRKSIFEISSS
jgi:SWI/SNF-related matrix-associated actin-dependent regulator of chromatin subfamily A3